VTVRNQAMGRTAGEALDALTTQLGPDEAGTLVIVRNLGPDRFFTAEQRQRLEQLMARWRSARDAGQSLSAAEQSELENLIDAEVRAAAERASALLGELSGRREPFWA
jgi:sarcosine oxidase gamma subunit